jgi:hypothetical protein
MDFLSRNLVSGLGRRFRRSVAAIFRNPENSPGGKFWCQKLGHGVVIAQNRPEAGF